MPSLVTATRVLSPIPWSALSKAWPIPPAIAVIDYRAGNLRSVLRALEKVGQKPVLINTPDELKSAHAIVFPGQGASPAAMRVLEDRGLAAPLRQAILDGRPFSASASASAPHGAPSHLPDSEEGDTRCLGAVPGATRRLPQGLKVPHMGWNQAHFTKPHPVFDGLPQDSNFYFVHSYYADPADPSLVAAVTSYGVTFCSAVAQGNMVATQFHPEKSGDLGLQIYANFARMAAEAPAAAQWK